MSKFFKKMGSILFNPRFAPTALKVALFVGTILFLINHGKAFFNGQMDPDRWISAGLSYCVPYMVNIHGQFISNARKRP
ncbi:nitrate/nitrite transporter NrtS [Laspinema olomoucense]|uniref:nitrate/nitrite transporter NrtS n=1 Tax=Laspinema olomoucense TaxID=3231600 RepID=UPI0021BB3494|nr:MULTISPECIES: nitrate/nitrite transporter NrtS [unclassified Laspinema]MCT7972186.1 nitrate/nitrite transporter NrtS [Laspinema sp. D3d]